MSDSLSSVWGHSVLFAKISVVIFKKLLLPQFPFRDEYRRVLCLANCHQPILASSGQRSKHIFQANGTLLMYVCMYLYIMFLVVDRPCAIVRN